MYRPQKAKRLEASCDSRREADSIYSSGASLWLLISLHPKKQRLDGDDGSGGRGCRLCGKPRAEKGGAALSGPADLAFDSASAIGRPRFGRGLEALRGQTRAEAYRWTLCLLVVGTVINIACEKQLHTVWWKGRPQEGNDDDSAEGRTVDLRKHQLWSLTKVHSVLVG